MTRLSSSFELGACAKVSPVSTVSANSGKEVETPLTVEFEIFPVCVCLRTNVNLKLSSSSLFKRKRKEGVGAEGGESGSCITLELLVKGNVSMQCCLIIWLTCIYSTKLSSPGSLFALYLVAGNEFGTRFKSTRRGFDIVTDAIVTGKPSQPQFIVDRTNRRAIRLF